MWQNYGAELGFLYPTELVLARRAVVLDMEIRQSGDLEKAKECIQVCEDLISIIGTS